MTSTGRSELSVLFVDNFDSFVFNLVDDFERRHCRVDVWRNDTPTQHVLDLAAALPAPRLVVLAPGPGAPRDAGCCRELIQQAPPDLPIFGVCLGHQAIIEACGGVVGRAPEIVHGKASAITHHGRGLFESIPAPMTVARYHSLVGTTLPDSLEVTGQRDGLVMAIAHRERPLWGVQFHPESILTPQGGILIDNLIRSAGRQATQTHA